MVSAADFRAQAADWIDAWNARDLERVLAHYADDVAICSPLVAERLGVEDGWLRGKEQLRAYFSAGMRKPQLRFELVEVLSGVQAYTVLYRRETGTLVTDCVELDAHGRIVRMVASYGAPPAQPAALQPDLRRRISSGSSFEQAAGYSRAVVDQDWVHVSGTTGFDYTSMTIASDLLAQTEQCFANLSSALAQAGCTLDDVLRVRYLLIDARDFEPLAPVFGKYFARARPAATAMVVGLVDPRIRIEIEATARIPRAGGLLEC